MNPSQSLRPLAIQTALGSDALLLTRFTVRERLSAPFEIEADLAAVDPNTDFNRVVGHQATIRLELGSKGTRYFSGYVSRLVQLANQGQFARYRATIVPWLWFLSRTSDCRVFQRASVLDIAEEVFGGHRFGSDFYDLQTSGAYPKRRYCVQYRETDFNFVNRLFESEGIYYWFKHASGGHRLVLADRIGASQPSPGYESLDYHEVEQGPIAGRQVVTDWVVEKEVQPVHYDLKDFDFKKPTEPLKGKHEIPRDHGMARFRLYDYPGEYFEPTEADRYAQIRLEELQARHEILRGTTTAMGLTVGGVFELKGHPQTSQNRKYLVTELLLTADAGEFASGSHGAEFFQCSFTAIPSTVPFRPLRITPRPIIQGVQTATVVGPAGEEIHTDEHARVKVQFHWDCYGQRDENSSCWIRVSQANAGAGWGSMITPRIGQEVIVEFLEGDPDRPIITGRVYNKEQPPPYADGKGVVSGIKSNTHKGSGNNEISLDDTAGKEKMTIHAQYDMNSSVGHDQTLDVSNDRTDKIGANDSETVGGTQTISVTGHRKLSVDGGQDVTITGAHDLTVTGHQKTTVGGGQELSVTGDDTTAVSAHQGITVGAGQDVTVTGAQTIESTGKQTLKAGGGQDLEVTGKQSLHATGEIEITSDSKIKLSAGGSSIEIGPSGITIEAAAKVTVKGATIALN